MWHDIASLRSAFTNQNSFLVSTFEHFFANYVIYTPYIHPAVTKKHIV